MAGSSGGVITSHDLAWSRDVVAQALDYASWMESLRSEDVVAIYGRFAPGRSLAEDFRARFGSDLDEETLNHGHETVIVAAELDADSERIGGDLADRGIAINVLCLQVFTQGGQQLLSRAWLKDRAVEPPRRLRLCRGSESCERLFQLEA